MQFILFGLLAEMVIQRSGERDEPAIVRQIDTTGRLAESTGQAPEVDDH